MSGFSQLDLKVNDFRSLKLSLIGIHLCAALAVLIAAVPLLVKCGGVLLCTISLWRSLHEVLADDDYITALSCCPDEGWLQVYNRKGDGLNIERLNHYASLPFLLVLHLSDEQGSGYWFVVPRDATTLDQFRRLRVVLRHHRILPSPARKSSVVR